MMNVCTGRRIAITLASTALMLFVLMAGCEEWADESRYNAPSDHTISKKKAMHLPGLNDPGINCVECHGSDLQGGTVGVSCFECHGRKWTGTGASPEVHNVNMNGVLHGAGLFSPADNCSQCHGADLRGGTVGVSCYACHTDRWAGGGVPSSHTVNKDGAQHKPGLNNPSANCSQCHGSDLRGGTVGVSCYKCHGAEWNDEDDEDDEDDDD